MQLQVVYAKALDSPRLSHKKALNSTQDKEALVAWFRRLYWCQQKLILLQRNGAVNGVRLVPKASLYPTKRGKAFLQEQEPCTIAERGLTLSN